MDTRSPTSCCPTATHHAHTLPGESPRAESSLGTGLAVLAAGHFAVDCCMGIWPVYKTMAGLDLAKAGAIATACSVVANGLQIGFGILADRGLAKLLLVTGVLLTGAVTFISYTNSYPLLFLLMLATSIGSAAFHPIGTGSAGALSRHRTGVLVALFLVGGNVGYALSQLLFTAIYRSTNGATVALLPLPLLAAAGLMRFVPRPPRADLSLAHWGRTVHGLIRPLAPLFVVQALGATVASGVVFLLPDFLAARGMAHWITHGGGHFALVVGTCLFLVPAGHAADRFGARRVLVLTTFATGLLLAAILWLHCSTAMLLLLVAAFGAFLSAISVVVVSEGNRMLPELGSGVSALLMGLPWCLAAFGSMAAGLLADPTRGGNPVRALVWIALCIPVALLACLFVQPRSAASQVHHGAT